MTKIPDQIIYRNEWGVLQLGPVGEKDKVGEDASTNLFNALKKWIYRNSDSYWKQRGTSSWIIS